MKITRLLEVDVACLAPLLVSIQRPRMVKMREKGGGIFSFKPTRNELPDIMNTQPPMFMSLGTAPVTPFSVVQAKLMRTCRPNKELAFNLQAAHMLYTHFRSNNVVSVPYAFGTMAIGLDRGLQYWTATYYARDGRPVVTFIDPRGGHGLTAAGRDVVFSAMHAAIRERIPDFDTAILEILQLPYDDTKKVPKGMMKPRRLQVYTLDGAPKYTFAELDTMLTQTLRLWDEVCADVAAEKKKKRSGDRGSLL